MLKTLSSVLACLKNVPTKRATPFPASTTEKWRPITDRYRSNIKKRGPPSANWSMGTRTSGARAPTCGGACTMMVRRPMRFTRRALDSGARLH
jgi:hypothetical protein